MRMRIVLVYYSLSTWPSLVYIVHNVLNYVTTYQTVLLCTYPRGKPLTLFNDMQPVLLQVWGEAASMSVFSGLVHVPRVQS